MFLTEDQWSLLQPLFPTASHPTYRGRPPVDHRPILDAILWKLATATPWDMLPSSLPSRETCYRRYRQWRTSGLLHDVIRVLHQDLVERGGLDPQIALSAGLIKLKRLGQNYIGIPEPALKGTWQFLTAMLFCQIAVNHIRGRAL